MEKIFYNGIILTMELGLNTEAVLIRDGVIQKTGEFEMMKILAPDAMLVDLKGHVMLPAFIDTHGHFSAYANALLQVPLNGTDCFNAIEEQVKIFVENNHIPEGDWIIASGYDHNMLAENRHPDREFLDRIAPNNPLILQHQSGHCGVLNTMALTFLDITWETKPPSGGVIGLNPNGELTGYLEETMYIQSLKKVPTAQPQSLLKAFEKAMNQYFSYGITTVQEGMMVTQMLPLYQMLLNEGILSLDVVGYPDISSMPEFVAAFPNSFKQYDQHFKIGGYKIFLDGSPQVRTAWMKSPYLNEEIYSGYGTMSDDDVLSAVKSACKENVQILAHCNGDGAIQQYIDAVKKVSVLDKNITKLKPVIVHAQLMTKDQLDEALALHMIPSFFVAHVFYWGDVHIKNFGFHRAKDISPAHSALDRGVMFTFHQDAPVIEPNMLETIQCAATRKTKDGVILGKEECISVLDALKAVTIHGAYQYSEEDRKGSIKEGKQADFVILNDNPLTVCKDRIKHIQVLETIKDGKTVFRR